MTKTKRLKRRWRSMLSTLRGGATIHEIFLHSDDAILSGFWTSDYIKHNFDHDRLMYVEDVGSWTKVA